MSFFPKPTLGPADSEELPTWFLEAVVQLVATGTSTPSKPPIVLDVTDEAMRASALLLHRFDYNLFRRISTHA
jgi:hypothetical protein